MPYAEHDSLIAIDELVMYGDTRRRAHALGGTYVILHIPIIRFYDLLPMVPLFWRICHRPSAIVLSNTLYS